MPARTALSSALAETVTPLTGASADFDVLLERIGDARFVLIGEATHGTHEFYRVRAEITKRLVREKGFGAIAAEADWPDALRVDRYTRGRPTSDADAIHALGDFSRFPRWMWRNADVLDFIGWAKSVHHVGFYGLDVYSLHTSIDAVIDYLHVIDAEAAADARRRYSCFDTFGGDPHRYGHATAWGIRDGCTDEVVRNLAELMRRRALAEDPDAQFHAERNAIVVANAEEYYRALYLGDRSTWNLRDMHMMDTLDALADHYKTKIVVWAHNSHVGDARATLRDTGEVTLGQLCRERYPDETALIGFSTYHGTVTAASDWGEPAERKRVRDALPGSYEAIFHECGVPSFVLDLHSLGESAGSLHEPHLQRAIGVVYRPQTERASHYFETSLPEQFDAIIHIDETCAVEPLDRGGLWIRGELPDTFPTGL